MSDLVSFTGTQSPSMQLQSMLLIFCHFMVLASTKVRLTNIKCVELDPPFATFEKCELKILSRGVVGLNLHVKLYDLPVSNISVNLSLFKKLSGYRPFLYNTTTDFCQFLKNRKRFPFLKIFMDFLLKDSNVNHTCPYDHDIILQGLVLKEYMFDKMPLPAGDYMFKLMVGAYNHWKADVKAYLSITD